MLRAIVLLAFFVGCSACNGPNPPVLQGPPRIVDVRALFNDELPKVQSPTVAVYSGMPHAIFAELKHGAHPREASWDFGSGAVIPDPPVSGGVYPDFYDTGEAVGVIPGDPGSYSASVTITNEQGSDTYEFTLQVSAPPLPDLDPLSHFDLPLWSGERDSLDRGFGALLETWSLSFGGGADPNVITDESTSGAVTWGAPGSYSASLTFSNPSGTRTIPFTLSVTPLAPPQLEIRRDWVWFVGNVELIVAGNEGGPSRDWTWDFGGATEDVEDNIAHSDFGQTVTFAGTEGLYHGTVTAVNAAGSDTVEFRILIQYPH